MFEDLFQDYLMHYGVGHLEGGHSGRYPWGSGDRPYQTTADFKAHVDQLKKDGYKETEICRMLDIGEMKNGKFQPSTGKLRALISLATYEERSIKVKKAQELKAKGLSNVAIGKEMGINESSVRSLLDEEAEAKMNSAMATANYIRKEIDSKGMVDVGDGWAQYLGVSKEKLNTALTILEMEGYHVYKGRLEQATNAGRHTIMKVAAAPEKEYKEIYNWENVKTLGDYISTDNGDSFEPAFVYPKSLDSKRLQIRYREDEGDHYDGMIELRRGVDDISLGDAQYSQVRIAVDDKYYLKGMAVYADDLPPGVDVRFNTNKSKGTPLEKTLKPMKTTIDENGNEVIDKRNPFGSLIKERGGQSYYYDKDGNKHLRLINKRADEGDWGEWADKLPSQFLSKQSDKLAKTQLTMALRDRQDEYETIISLTNPTIKKLMLEKFADSCDSNAVRLHAAALPGQKYQVILPVDSLKDDEVYAPNYKPGTKLALIRYPHGGTFEIPVVTVTDKNPEAKSRIGNTAQDAIGINHKVAARLSGADFDGDTVMVIPMGRKSNIKHSEPLEGLKDFDPSMSYPEVPGMRYMKNPETGVDNTQREMGIISNLITDMTLKGAKDDELAKAVRHSMVVIDAAKHKLNYKQSELDNDIALLKKKYQGHLDENGNPKGGASTIISAAKSKVLVPERKEGQLRTDPKTGKQKMYYIDPDTGEKLYTETNRYFYKVYNDKTKKWQNATMKDGVLLTKNPNGGKWIEVPADAKVKSEKAMQYSTRMAEAKDATTIISDDPVPMEYLYANYANGLKAMANEARKEYLGTQEKTRDPQAAKNYASEVKSLKAKVATAQANAPKERQAQIAANTQARAVYQANPGMSTKDLKKYKTQALQAARQRLGAKREPIVFSDREWEAIQAGAIGYTTLQTICKYVDDDTLKSYAMPKNKQFKLSENKINQMRAMQDAGYTNAQIADRFGISASTVSKAVRGELE